MLKKLNGSKVIDHWIYIEYSEKVVRQSGNIGQNMTLVTLTWPLKNKFEDINFKMA